MSGTFQSFAFKSWLPGRGLSLRSATSCCLSPGAGSAFRRHRGVSASAGRRPHPSSPLPPALHLRVHGNHEGTKKPLSNKSGKYLEEDSHPLVDFVLKSPGGPPSFASAVILDRSSSLSLGAHTGGSRLYSQEKKSPDNLAAIGAFLCLEEDSHPLVDFVLKSPGGPPSFASAVILDRSSSLSLGALSGGSRLNTQEKERARQPCGYRALSNAWKRTRTSTTLRSLVPETSVSTNFTIQAEDEVENTGRGGFCQYDSFSVRFVGGRIKKAG